MWTLRDSLCRILSAPIFLTRPDGGASFSDSEDDCAPHRVIRDTQQSRKKSWFSEEDIHVPGSRARKHICIVSDRGVHLNRVYLSV